MTGPPHPVVLGGINRRLESFLIISMTQKMPYGEDRTLSGYSYAIPIPFIFPVGKQEEMARIPLI